MFYQARSVILGLNNFAKKRFLDTVTTFEAKQVTLTVKKSVKNRFFLNWKKIYRKNWNIPVKL